MPSQGVVVRTCQHSRCFQNLSYPHPSPFPLRRRLGGGSLPTFISSSAPFEPTCKELNFRRAVQFRSNLDHAGTRIVYMKSSTKDKIRGNVDQAKGSVQEKAGRASR